MKAEDFAEPEIAVTAAVTAALFSPGVRRMIRKGLVYGVAGLLTAGDTLATFAKGVAHGVQETKTPTAREEQSSTGIEATP